MRCMRREKKMLRSSMRKNWMISMNDSSWSSMVWPQESILQIQRITQNRQTHKTTKKSTTKEITSNNKLLLHKWSSNSSWIYSNKILTTKQDLMSFLRGKLSNTKAFWNASSIFLSTTRRIFAFLEPSSYTGRKRASFGTIPWFPKWKNIKWWVQKSGSTNHIRRLTISRETWMDWLKRNWTSIIMLLDWSSSGCN